MVRARRVTTRTPEAEVIARYHEFKSRRNTTPRLPALGVILQGEPSVAEWESETSVAQERIVMSKLDRLAAELAALGIVF